MTSPHENSAEHVCVLGLGQMGLVCAAMLAADSEPRCRVTLLGHPGEDAERLQRTRTSDRLPGFVLPAHAHATTDEHALASATLIVSAIPVQHTRAVWQRIAPRVNKGVGVVSVSKGIEVGTLLRPTQTIADTLQHAGVDNPDAPPRPFAALSGPTIAAELAKKLPAAMIAASHDESFARQVQHAFGTSWVRVYTHADLTGVELAGAVKNVIALAAGICDGLRAGNNAKSALLARGLAEIVRLGVAMGASPQTFFGIAGVGDLATTCFSPEGRNRSCGEALGKGQSLTDYLAKSTSVVEGVETTRAVLALARRHNVDMPITIAVHEVLFAGRAPVDAIGLLMSRERKSETVG